MLAFPALAALAVAAASVAGPAPGAKNFLLIAIDDLRPMFGKSFDNEEVLTPHMDKHFIDGGGSAMQHSYVQVAVCGPSRASILTGRRPDTTYVGTSADGLVGWCWCQRTDCNENALFMTVPTWFAKNGYVTAGNGKVFHPDGCNTMHRPEYPRFAHEVYGDDPRAWNYGEYGVEGLLQAPFDNVTTQFSEEQYVGISFSPLPPFQTQPAQPLTTTLFAQELADANPADAASLHPIFMHLMMDATLMTRHALFFIHAYECI
eukprot:gene24516-26572_t